MIKPFMAGSVLFLQKRIVKSKRVSKRGCLPYVFCQQTHLKYANFPADPSQFPPRGPMVFFFANTPSESIHWRILYPDATGQGRTYRTHGSCYSSLITGVHQAQCNIFQQNKMTPSFLRNFRKRCLTLCVT